MNPFQKEILEGIPQTLPKPKAYDPNISHAPYRTHGLSHDEKKLALVNALRYFKPEFHATLAKEFLEELECYGHIYMYRFRPDAPIYARPIIEYPHQCQEAAAIMMMIQNNLDPSVAQHPHELITYGGNGAVFQNWAQYRLVMAYLAKMTSEQTLVLYSGHPLGLFPSYSNAPRVVITNGLMIPNYSTPEDLNRGYALGVTQFGQMTAGSFMYIGPQGIVHGTTLTLLNAGRLVLGHSNIQGKIFVSSGLGGMSGAQAKAAVIAGAIGVIAEINPTAAYKRHQQGWVDEIFSDLESLFARIKQAQAQKEALSLAYLGNIVDLWEALITTDIEVLLGSDQTSLHNPYNGGYYPVDLSFEDSLVMMQDHPEQFKQYVHISLQRQVKAINQMAQKGMYFFDYGNAFLLEAKRAGADILNKQQHFKYPSYVENIMGPLCFDYGFGPFRWVCCSGDENDLNQTDSLAIQVLEQYLIEAQDNIKQQLQDNLNWIKHAKENHLVVGSKARILYADSLGRIKIAQAFNQAIREGLLKGPIVLGRDHHDVSGTDSPYRETANIYDGSQFTADMAVHNVIGDAFRGATWVALHNGGGVGFGEVINGGFGLVLDGKVETEDRLQSMLFWDVNNGIARRGWARNLNAISTIQKAMQEEPKLDVTLPQLVSNQLLQTLFD